MLLSTAYLPPIQWFTKLLGTEQGSNGACVYVEALESYIKQTYRNRCVIDSPAGPLALTIPVEKPDNGSRLIRDLRISEHGNWRHQHWQALSSSYFNSPFFEYYQDDFHPFYEKRYDFLMDFNEALIEKCCELIDMQPMLQRTTSYQEKTDVSSDEFEDFRDVISPKKDLSLDTSFSPTPYYQVFSAKHGFLPNLSIVDLIFNMGPESIFVLQDSKRSLKSQE